MQQDRPGLVPEHAAPVARVPPRGAGRATALTAGDTARTSVPPTTFAAIAASVAAAAEPAPTPAGFGGAIAGGPVGTGPLARDPASRQHRAAGGVGTLSEAAHEATRLGRGRGRGQGQEQEQRQQRSWTAVPQPGPSRMVPPASIDADDVENSLLAALSGMSLRHTRYVG